MQDKEVSMLKLVYNADAPEPEKPEIPDEPGEKTPQEHPVEIPGEPHIPAEIPETSAVQ